MAKAGNLGCWVRGSLRWIDSANYLIPVKALGATLTLLTLRRHGSTDLSEEAKAGQEGQCEGQRGILTSHSIRSDHQCAMCVMK